MKKTFVAILLAVCLLFSCACGASANKLNIYTKQAMIEYFARENYICGELSDAYYATFGLDEPTLDFALTISHRTENKHAFIFAFKSEEIAKAFYGASSLGNLKLSGKFVIHTTNLKEINKLFE